MFRQRGTTLVEVLLVALLTSIVVGSLASLYSYTGYRAAHATAAASVAGQVQGVLDALEATIGSAVKCEVVTSSGKTGLKCLMPLNGEDRNGDGYLDSFTPSAVSKRGIEKFGAGKRVWFYMSSPSGNFTASGTILHRAERADDSLPTGDDVDRRWTYYYDSGTPRWNLIDTIIFTVDNRERKAKAIVKASSLVRAERKVPVVSSAEAPQSYTIIAERTFFWRHWRR